MDYEAGMPVQAIAAKFGMHRGTIPKLVRGAGVSLRIPGLSAEDRVGAVVMYTEGATLREVADRFGVDEKTVRDAVSESGVDVRPRGRRPS